MISSDVFSDLEGSGIALATLVLGFGYILGPRGQIKCKIWDNILCLTLPTGTELGKITSTIILNTCDCLLKKKTTV